MRAEREDHRAVRATHGVIGAVFGGAVYLTVAWVMMSWQWWGLGLAVAAGVAAAMLFGERFVELAKELLRLLSLWW